MISGYTQLRCGLSVYHWQILVYLAWFSCLTHLACLTFLRNYLYNHPGERIWRLVGMSSLVILLIVGLLPTGKASIYGPADYASCSFRNIARVKSDDRYESEDVNFDYATMIVSILFVGFGFLTRFIKLHRSLSIGLRRLYKWCLDTQVKTTPTIAKIRVLLIYRPVLAIFLTMRAVLDMWSSYFIEVRQAPTTAGIPRSCHTGVVASC